MSYGKLSNRQRALRHRAAFPALWRAFLRDHFDGPEHVAFVFGVDGSTARKWWHGEHSPGGHAVALAFEMMAGPAGDALCPDAMARLKDWGCEILSFPATLRHCLPAFLCGPHARRTSPAAPFAAAGAFSSPMPRRFA